VRHHLSLSVSYHIPIFFLYLFCFLISVQISANIAFQSILVLSVIILFDVLQKNEKWTAEMKTGELEEDDLRHLLFHRWLKYWNFFLGIWWLLSLRVGSSLNATQYAFLLFTFVVVYFMILLRNLSIFGMKDMLFVLMTAGVLVGLDSVLRQILNQGIPLYIQAALMLIAFDLGDGYFHHCNFHEKSHIFWSRKTALYLLSLLYIVQIHLMMSNPVFSFQEIYNSLFYRQNATEISANVLQNDTASSISKISKTDGVPATGEGTQP
jgi:hypothetical protein